MKKNVGIELFRFVGSFFVVMGHLFLSSIIVFPDNGYLSLIFSGNIARVLMMVSVPIFLIVGGYFVFSGEDDFKCVKKAMFTLCQYLFWITVFLFINYVVLYLCGGSNFTGSYFEIVSAVSPLGMNSFNYNMTYVFMNYDMYNLQTNHLWYLLSYSGFLLVAPFFKSFFRGKNIKVIRYCMVLSFVAAFVGSNLGVLANYIDNFYVDNAIKNYNVLDINKIIYPLFWYFLLGGWIRRDKALSEFIKKVPSVVYLVLFILSIGILPLIYNSEYLVYFYSNGVNGIASLYDSIILLPSTLSLFSFFYSLKCSDNKVSRLALKNGYKTGAIYIIHPIIIFIFINVFGLSSYVNFYYSINSGIVQMIAVIFTSLLVYVLSYFLAGLFLKIPYLKKMC